MLSSTGSHRVAPDPISLQIPAESSTEPKNNAGDSHLNATVIEESTRRDSPTKSQRYNDYEVVKSGKSGASRLGAFNTNLTEKSVQYFKEISIVFLFNFLLFEL